MQQTGADDEVTVSGLVDDLARAAGRGDLASIRDTLPVLALLASSQEMRIDELREKIIRTREEAFAQGQASAAETPASRARAWAEYRTRRAEHELWLRAQPPESYAPATFEEVLAGYDANCQPDFPEPPEGDAALTTGPVAHPEGKALVDMTPDMALLASMATCLHHGFGLLDADQQHSMLQDMRKLFEEVVGLGYYAPEVRGRYLQWLCTDSATLNTHPFEDKGAFMQETQARIQEFRASPNKLYAQMEMRTASGRVKFSGPLEPEVAEHVLTLMPELRAEGEVDQVVAVRVLLKKRGASDLQFEGAGRHPVMASMMAKMLGLGPASAAH